MGLRRSQAFRSHGPRRRSTSTSTQNLLLDALPEDERALVLSRARDVRLRRRETLLHADSALQAAYFPTSGLLALVIRTTSGHTVEVNQVGREGMVGLPAFLGVGHMPVEAVVQLSGRALAVSVEALHAMTRHDTSLSRLLKRYTFMRMVEMGQNATCNRLHSLEQRTARWLLETADRAGRTEFWMTHEFLAELLGVQRPRVSEAIARLQAAGLVDSPRQRIRLLDIPGLETAACECYIVVREELRRLVTGA